MSSIAWQSACRPELPRRVQDGRREGSFCSHLTTRLDAIDELAVVVGTRRSTLEDALEERGGSVEKGAALQRARGRVVGGQLARGLQGAALAGLVHQVDGAARGIGRLQAGDDGREELLGAVRARECELGSLLDGALLVGDLSVWSPTALPHLYCSWPCVPRQQPD